MKDMQRIFCDRALNGAENLPAAERADLYEFAASVLTDHPAAAQAALLAAENLRQAEAAQLQFRNLLNN